MIRKIYSMIYDNKKLGDQGKGEFLGDFRFIHRIQSDAWVDDFIGENAETGEVCLILSREVTGYGGGISYQVFPLPGLIYTGECD